MRPIVKKTLKGLLAVAALFLAGALGWAVALTFSSGSGGSTSGIDSYAGSYATGAAKSAADQSARSLSSPTAPEATTGSSAQANTVMVIRTASVELRVDDVDAAVRRIRAISSALGAEVSDLSVSGGDGTPRPIDRATAGVPNPASAVVTLRVAASKLDELEAKLTGLGHVLSQSSNESDVTQQHVDMAARLKNLRAEEERLRSFLGKATRVSEMLEVERELSRVRGEIESMQAQVDYLERQVALSTVTVSLVEPAAVTSPGTGGWGFDTALRDGVRATAALARVLVTVAVPLLVVGVPVALVFLVARAIVRRRRRARLARTGDHTTPDSEASRREVPHDQSATPGDDTYEV